MKTDVTNGEKTFWIGITEAQLKTLRVAMTSFLLANEADLSFPTAIRRTNNKIDHALVWETVETLEHALGELNKRA